MNSWVGVPAEIVLVICIVTALLDVGMNGVKYAGWAPWGIGIALLMLLLMTATGFTRDDGRYGNSPLKSWFDKLSSKKGLCCSFADGATIEDVDWDVKDGHYRVRLDGKWIDVPDAALITEPNRLGPAIVWPVFKYNSTDVDQIRCFIPGAGG